MAASAYVRWISKEKPEFIDQWGLNFIGSQVFFLYGRFSAQYLSSITDHERFHLLPAEAVTVLRYPRETTLAQGFKQHGLDFGNPNGRIEAFRCLRYVREQLKKQKQLVL